MIIINNFINYIMVQNSVFMIKGTVFLLRSLIVKDKHSIIIENWREEDCKYETETILGHIMRCHV